jgi:hypothetical protein
MLYEPEPSIGARRFERFGLEKVGSVTLGKRVSVPVKEGKRFHRLNYKSGLPVKFVSLFRELFYGFVILYLSVLIGYQFFVESVHTTLKPAFNLLFGSHRFKKV